MSTASKQWTASGVMLLTLFGILLGGTIADERYHGRAEVDIAVVKAWKFAD